MNTDKKSPQRLINNRLATFFNVFINSSSSFLLIAVLLLSKHSYALSLQQAENIALEADPLIASHEASARALLDESVSDNALPDPKFRFGLFNLPVESLSTTQEPTTQLRLGVQQHFPRGDTLDLKQQQSEWLSQSSSQQAREVRLKTLRDLRETFLHLYYETQASNIIRETMGHFTNLVKITEAQYAAGRVNQQDVIHADLELSRLEDRTAQIQSKKDEFRAQLAVWLGESAWDTIENTIPTLPELPSSFDTNAILTQHPAVLIETAKVEAMGKNIDMAKQDYKPGFDAFFEYRKRNGDNPNGSDREDMLAAMVTMDIPLFTENRQDKKVSASEQKTLAAKFRRDDKLRLLKRMFDKDFAIYKRLGQRALIYKQDLLESAKNNSAASLNAYQSGVSEFSTLMRARITELDVRLADLRIRVDRKRALARLLYITGEQQ